MHHNGACGRYSPEIVTQNPRAFLSGLSYSLKIHHAVKKEPRQTKLAGQCGYNAEPLTGGW
jgi:hypothetical protein